MKNRMARKLTKKQKGFVKDIIKGETGVQAAFNNYDTTDYSTAGSIATENLQKPKIINALEKALPDELLSKIHREGLFATRPIYSKEGELVGEDADFGVRHRYLDSAYKIKGSYAPERKDVRIREQFPLDEPEQVKANDSSKDNSIQED